jgi:DNA-binding MarR family transcriptional regulator
VAQRRAGSRLSVLFEVFAASREVGELVAAALADSPLGPEEYAIYSVLFDEGPHAPTELARRTGMPPTSMSHVVRTMRERGHATRSPDPADGRSYRIVLTEAGLAAHAATSIAFSEADERFRTAFGPNLADASMTLTAIGRAARLARERLSVDAVDETA